MLRVIAVGLAVTLCLTQSIAGQVVEPSPALEGFERLIGGRWYLGDETFHTFAWGVGGRSVKVQSYSVTAGSGTDESETLVSELTFLYHPGEEVVKGYGVAIGMGLDFFEYDVHFTGDQIVLDLEAFGPAALDSAMRETWTFTDDDRYEWELLGEESSVEWSRLMGGTFERRR
jgi:hypothetical protein